MPRFLIRSKSTRELRPKFSQTSQEECMACSKPMESPKSMVSRERNVHIHSPSRLNKRADTVAKDPTAIVAEAQCSRIDRFMRLKKQQSMDSIGRQGARIPDRSLQNSLAFAVGENGSSSNPTVVRPYPPRTSSRAGYSSFTNNPAIGVAIGSPSEGYMRKNFLNLNTPSPIASKCESPGFFLPPEPFVMGDDDRRVTASTTTTMPTPTRETREARGWKKLFGRSLFGTRKSKKPSVFSAPKTANNVISPITSSHSSEEGISFTDSTRATSPEVELATGKDSPSSVASEFAPPSLLNIDIPTVEMERYSIMFQSLLQKEPLGSFEEPKKVTLFERRNSTKEKSPTKQAPRLHLESLKRSATTAGHGIRSISPSRFGHEEISQSEAAQNSRKNRRSHTVGGAVQKLSLITPPGHGFVLAGETIPSPALGPHGEDPFETIAIDNETLQEHTLRRSSSISKFSQQEVSIDTPRASFDQGDDEWVQKNVGETEDDYDGTLADNEGRSPIPATSSRVEGLGQDHLLWELVRRDPDAPIPPIPDIKTEEDAVVAAQISIARQISVSRRQLTDFSLGPKSGQENGEGEVLGMDSQCLVANGNTVLRRAQSVRAVTPKIVIIGGHKPAGGLCVEYGNVRKLNLEGKGCA